MRLSANLPVNPQSPVCCTFSNSTLLKIFYNQARRLHNPDYLAASFFVIPANADNKHTLISTLPRISVNQRTAVVIRHDNRSVIHNESLKQNMWPYYRDVQSTPPKVSIVLSSFRRLLLFISCTKPITAKISAE